MASLTRLSLRGCTWLRKLPNSIGNLTSLLELDLSTTRMRELPDSIGELKKELPYSIGGLESLLDLNFQKTKITKLLASIGRLQRLIVFGSKIRDLPNYIADLKRLREMHLGFTQIRELPSSIGGLESLAALHLWGSKIVEVPTPIGNLKKLECLVLLEINIREQPKDMGMLENFKVLESDGCRNITWMGESPKANKWNLSINITWPPQLWSLNMPWDDPRSLTWLPSNLCHLVLRDVKSPIEQSFFSNLRYLSEFTLFECWLREIEFRQLESLQYLTVEECKSLVTLSLSSLGKFKELIVRSCIGKIKFAEEIINHELQLHGKVT
ncbi:hypothetical protein EUGRSUZ_C02548 [Eucalyptus grandis]|uniref:Uncharacterized protein n=2 Tax=Eucalyptus grandis TaxID=71139 RepID=A0ACC3LGL0_EUCGR|nr:hypothetical protein EUGRSUZ_C02548 [Eucalyptus grandis]